MLAIDWGTSSLRVYRLDANGTVSDVRSSEDGILSVKDAAFAATLEHAASEWLASETPIVMSGMIGSRQGWSEAAYVPCPAGLPEIASALSAVQWTSGDQQQHRAWIAPGLSCLDQAGVADVMRGEEVQILGILEDLGKGEHVVCLPGTHSKWARVQDDRIVSFRTHMTGEVFAVLKQHSILGRTMPTDEFDEAGFVAGVSRAADPGGLLHHLFGVRSQVLAGNIAEAQSASYLSGIVIGHELRAAANEIERFHLVGDAALTALYELAASTMSKTSVIHESGAAPRGLFALAQYLD
ncbi:MAG: 2-dehydro-3-deoxygalactonokinase [Betaproteobacteria bacterium]|nr:MAG: 2-dehydro-3-deoxygalactonokinase [Betaproteobacteria bacterium]